MERIREQIFANQKGLGVIPPNTQLTPWPDSLPKWDTLNATEKKVYARQAEIFGAYALTQTMRLAGSCRPSRTWASSITH